MDADAKRLFDVIGLVGLVSLALWAGANRQYWVLAALGVGTAVYLIQQRSQP